MKISTIVIGAIAGAMTMSSMAATMPEDHHCPMPAQIKKVNDVFVGTDQQGGQFIEKFAETDTKKPGQFTSATHYAPGVSQHGQIACNYSAGATLWLTQPKGKVTTAYNTKWNRDMCLSADPVHCEFGVNAK